MTSITFKLKTITPMFMAGADGAKFELRPPSIKGAMRFWWRAYHWGRNSAELKPEDIEKEEGKIFGTTSGNGQKSRFSIQVKPSQFSPETRKLPSHPIQVSSRGRTFPVNILEYLAYGTQKYERGKGNVFIREYLPVNQEISISLHILDRTVEIAGETLNVKEEVIRSFYVMSVFGGLGAKSRNAFGSFTVTNPEVFAQYGLPYPFPDQIFLKQYSKNTIPTFSAFSKGMKIFKLKQSYRSWDDCLAEIGKIYRDARNNLERRHHYEKRQYIGAPIVAMKETKSRLERHAKPYFMRVVEVSHSFEGYILYLPSKYCEGITKDRNQRSINHDEVNTKFLESCAQLNSYFQAKMEVYYE